MHFVFGPAFIALFATVFSTASASDPFQFSFNPVVGGFLAEDTGDGIFDRALPGTGFMVGKAIDFYPYSQEYQGAYEWNLADPSFTQIDSSRISLVTLTFTRTGSGYSIGAPDIEGLAAYYAGNGNFGFEDVGLGIPVASFLIKNMYGDPGSSFFTLDITESFLAARSAATQYLGFNFRTEATGFSGQTISSGYTALRLNITTVPEPSTFAMVAAGVMGLALRRRKAIRS